MVVFGELGLRSILREIISERQTSVSTKCRHKALLSKGSVFILRTSINCLKVTILKVEQLGRLWDIVKINGLHNSKKKSPRII